MPIRHCQKCGLKVLVDESQLAANPFYCQRCAATAKAAAAKESAPAPTPAHKPDPAPSAAPAAVSAPVATATAPAPVKSIKVLCPYCRASFTGRVPNKPAKGSCPVCQKDLVLLPDGSISGATEFNLQDWKAQNQPGKVATDQHKPVIPIKLETRGTKIVRPNQPQPAAVSDLEAPPDGLDALNEHTMLDMGRTTPAPKPRPAPGPRPDASEIEAAFPGGLGEHTILDMGRTTPRSTTRPSQSEVDDAFPTGTGEQTILDMGRPVDTTTGRPTSQEANDDFPTGMGDQTMLGMGQPAPLPPPPPPNQQDMNGGSAAETQESPPVEAPPPEPQPVPVPEPAPPPKRLGSLRPSPTTGGQPQGSGKMILALFLLLLPVIAGVTLFFLRENASVKKILEKVDVIARKGLRKIHEEMTKEPPKAKPVEPKTPVKTEPEKPPEKTPEEIERAKQSRLKFLDQDIPALMNELNMLKRKLKENEVGATPEQKERFEEFRKEMEPKQKRYDDYLKEYKQLTGKDYE